MTGEMLELARANAAEAGAVNVEFLQGHIEAIPPPDAAVDVIISNCVINLPGIKLRSSPRASGCRGPVAGWGFLTSWPTMS